MVSCKVSWRRGGQPLLSGRRGYATGASPSSRGGGGGANVSRDASVMYAAGYIRWLWYFSTLELFSRASCGFAIHSRPRDYFISI